MVSEFDLAWLRLMEAIGVEKFPCAAVLAAWLKSIVTPRVVRTKSKVTSNMTEWAMLIRFWNIIWAVREWP